MRPPVLLAVDGNSLLHRAFHARNGVGGPGESVWAVRGLLTQLVAAVERVGADVVIVGFDDPKDSVRRATWPEYKATRADKPEVLVSQLLLAGTVLRELGIGVCTPPGLEADDVLCSAASAAALAGAQTVLMTSDRDSFALINDSTRVLRIINGGVEASPLITAERLFLMLGIRPQQYQDYAALRGDPSDNLPGVSGIGPKTAARLLGALGDARAVFADLDAGGARVAETVGASIAARLSEPESRRRWERNCAAMQMRCDVGLEVALSAPGVARGGRLPLPQDAVRTIFTEHRLLATLPRALRVLAYVDGPDVAPPELTTANALHSPEPDWGQPRAGSRFPRLPKRRAGAEHDQLALF